jgi:hypothetical protein
MYYLCVYHQNYILTMKFHTLKVLEQEQNFLFRYFRSEQQLSALQQWQ